MEEFALSLDAGLLDSPGPGGFSAYHFSQISGPALGLAIVKKRGRNSVEGDLDTECRMAGKLDREREAIAAAERELLERRNRLAEMERDEQEKELQRLVKRLSVETAIAVLTRAVALKPRVALEALSAAANKDGAPSASKASNDRSEGQSEAA